MRDLSENVWSQYVCRGKLGVMSLSKGLPNIRLEVLSSSLIICMRTEERAEVSRYCLTSPTFQGWRKAMFPFFLAKFGFGEVCLAKSGIPIS